MTCKTIRILGNNIFANATLSSRSCISSEYSVDNVKNRGQESIARYDLTAPVVIDIDYDSPQMINELRIIESNFSGSSTTEFIIYDEPGQTGNITYQSDGLTINGLIPMGVYRWGIDEWNTPQDAWGAGTVDTTLENSVYGKSARIIITDPTNPDGAIDIGYIMMGEGYDFENNYAYGRTYSQRGASNIVSYANGLAVDDDINDQTTFTLPMNYLTRTDYISLMEMERLNKGKAMYFDTAPWETGILRKRGQLVAIMEAITDTQSDNNYWSANIIVRKA